MALDFPNAPTLNQTFTAPNGVIWVWDGVKWTAITSTSPFTGQGNVGRNLLHNPLFNVAQRGAGPFVLGATYSLDRWSFGVNLDTVSVTQSAIGDAARAQIGDEAAQFQLVNTFTGNAGAAAATSILHKIEGVRRLAGKTVTVSFYAATQTGSLKFGCGLDQIFGTSGSPSAAVLGSGQSVTLTTTWTRYSLIFALPSSAGKTLGTDGNDHTILNLWYSAGSNYTARSGGVGVQAGTIGLWGVQLEIGSVATPLEKPDPRYDLSNCQRFYQVGYVQQSIGAAVTNGWTNNHALMLPTIMRATPTVTMGTPTQLNCTGTAVTGFTAGSLNHAYTINAAATGVQSTVSWTASADL